MGLYFFEPMIPPAETPLSFDRLPQAQFAGCLAYFLLVPAFGVVVALVVGLATAGIWNLAGWRDGTVPLILSAAGFLGAVCFGVRGYAQRAGTRILVFSDRLELTEGKTPVVFRYDELAWLSGPGLAFLSRSQLSPISGNYALTLKRKDGRRLELRNEEWPLPGISKELLTRAVPTMTRVLSDRLDSGETIEFRPGLLLAFRYLLFGAILTGLGGFLLLLGLKKIHEEGSYKSLAFPIFLTTAGLGSLVMVSRSRGRLLMDRTGVRARSRDPVLPWERIVDVQILPDAMNIKADDGRVIPLGALAGNYDACIELMNRRRQARA